MTGGIFMWLGKVVGTVVAPTKDESLIGSKLLVVQPLNLDGMNTISLQVAVDTVGAGNGETVLVVSGTSARRVVKNDNSAADAAIIGIVENIDLQGISKAQYWVQK
jgi:ethanolamine utilization protein EutN